MGPSQPPCSQAQHRGVPPAHPNSLELLPSPFGTKLGFSDREPSGTTLPPHAMHTGNSPRDHDGHTAPGPAVVWLRAWPQRKGWKMGEAAVCSSLRDSVGGVPWPPGGSHGPLTRLQEAGSLGRAGLRRGGQQTQGRRKLPCRPRSSPSQHVRPVSSVGSPSRSSP